MKVKMILLAALVGVAAMSANAGVRFGVSIGLPLPVVVSTPIVCAPSVAPVSVAVVQSAPACPGVDYVWVPGFWSYRTTGYVWVPGTWCYRPAHVVRGHFYARHRW